MPNCKICGSHLKPEISACLICGTPADQKPIKKFSKMGIVAAQEKAKEVIKTEEARGTDIEVARRLIHDSEKAVANNDSGAAIEYARAARRAADIARRRLVTETRISNFKKTIDELKDSGMATQAVEKVLSEAISSLETGDMSRANTLLRRSVVRRREERFLRYARKIFEDAQKKVTYCRERGGDDSSAQEELNKAEKALKDRDIKGLKNHCQRAKDAADKARRYARAESFLHTANDIAAEAAKSGANIKTARGLLVEARGALKDGLYADVQRLSREARQAVKEAKKYASVDEAINKVEKEVRREERRKSDVSEVSVRISDARKALDNREFARARAIAKEVHSSIKEIAALRQMKASMDSLRLDIDDLRTINADYSELEYLLEEAQMAYKARKPDEVKRIIIRARKSAEYAREDKQREAMTLAVEKILERVGARKLDKAKVDLLIRQVEDAALLGRAINIEKIIDEGLELPDHERLRQAMARLEGVRDLLVELKKTDIDLSMADEIISRVKEQLDAGNFENAEALIGQLENITHKLKESLEDSAREIIDKSRDAVSESEQKGFSLPDARGFLEKAEESFKEGKIFEALELARLAHIRAEQALEAREKHVTIEGAETYRIAVEKSRRIQRELWDIQQKIEELVKADIDASKVKEGVSLTLRALDAGQLDEAQVHLDSTKHLVDILWNDLSKKSEEMLEHVKAAVTAAQDEGVPLPPLDEMLARGEQALNEGRMGEVLLLISGIDKTVSAAKAAQQHEQTRIELERGRRASKLLSRVKHHINELKVVNVDITDSEKIINDAETAMREKKYTEVESILHDLDQTVNELRAQLVVAAKAVISRAEENLYSAETKGIILSEASHDLETAKRALEDGYVNKAIEYGSAAEKKASEAIDQWRTQQESLKYKDKEMAKNSISEFKKIMADLSRADIDVMGSSEALNKAEDAYNDMRYSDVEKELTEVVSLAKTLQDGLKNAASDLISKSRKSVQQAKESGLDVDRGEKVLKNAEEALSDGRYVETIEYSKVINDIVETSKRHKDIRDMEEQISSLQQEVQRAQNLGIDMSTSLELVKEAQESVALGKFEDLSDTAKKISIAVETAQQVYVSARLKAMMNAIQECKERGLETTPAESLYKKAEEAIKQKDFAAVDDFAKQVEVLMESTRRAADAEQVEKDIRSFEEMLNQASRVGVEVGDLRPMALQARDALLSRDFVKAESLVTEGKSKVRERRRQQFADRYESKMESISTIINSAKQFGANVAEAERILLEASKALEKQDLNMADILVKQAEVSAGIQIQNFIKNRYPNLVVKLPEEGLQSEAWNNYSIEVANKGKLGAKNIQIKLDGNVEVKGLEPIAELGVNETKKLEFGVRPKDHGEVPLNVEILYQRYFDENKYDLKDLKTLKVEEPGTYLVEDVFLVHNDGRLITHQTRKFRETIDDDIFSGMLTVVQDFVKDSFRQKTKVGLKRLEFGESKILLERSEHIYLACVIVGDEPDLLPLYMVEVLKQIEEKYGPNLDAWTGMMKEVEGIEEYVARLIFVTGKPDASLGQLDLSPLSEIIKTINSAALLDDDKEDVKKLLTEARDQIPIDTELAWNAINNARERARTSLNNFRNKMKDIKDATHKYVDDMREMGEDISQAELLMNEADEAYEVGKFEKLQDIYTKMREGVERAKDSQIVKRIEKDLTSLIQEIHNSKAEGADTSMAESYLSRIQDALEEKNYRLVEDYFKRASESLEASKKDSLLKRSRDELENLTSMVVEAKELGVAVDEAEGLLKKAAEALENERTQELEAMLDAARGSAIQQVQEHLKERYPRLFLTLPSGGLQTGMLNRYLITITNKGNWPARGVELRTFGNIELVGSKSIQVIEPNATRSFELGLKPMKAGTIPLDLQLFYQRPLDESKYELTESKEVKIEPSGTYQVEDVILIHNDGRTIASESRLYRDQSNEERLTKLQNKVQRFIRDSFISGGEIGLKRMGFDGKTLLIEPGPYVYLGVSVGGDEPRLLPLYMVELLGNIKQKFGDMLEIWDGDASKLEGIQEMLRSLFYVTLKADADIGPLRSSAITAGSRLMTKGVLKGEGEMDFVETARSTIEDEDYTSAYALIEQIKMAVARPAEELTAEVKAAVLATKETIGLELSDEEVATYVEVLRHVLQAIQRAKQKAGIGNYWPVKRIAVKPFSQIGLDAVTSFRKIIVNQSLTKELDIVPPTETWRGMNVRAQVDTEALNRSYKLWAKKIEILLKSQDAWKIKSGIDKGEYAVGIDGQKVKIDKEMVWFEESLPDTVIEESYDGGIVYVDSEMTEDILSEGYAKEIVRIIRDIRKELNLPEEQGIQLQIRASMGLYKMLKNWREYISSQTNSADLRFVEEPPTDGYIIEATLGEESFALAVKAAEA